MSKLGADIQRILKTDLFRLQPAGYTPLRALSYTDQNEPKSAGVPKNESGEVHLISDRSRVVLNDNETAPLYSLYADQALKQHIVGRRLDRLPFIVRHTLPASWQASLETFNENYEYMRAHLRAKQYDLEKHGLVDLVYEDTGLSSRYDQVGDLWKSICLFLSRYLRERGDDELKAYVSHMDKAQRSLYLNVPPLRFSYRPERRRAADALMYVRSAEEGAELFLGWQRETKDAEGISVRMDMLEERGMSARSFMNATRARAGVAYAIPPMFPYGMTGGVDALVIQPRLESYLLDDWGRSLPGDWWKQYVGKQCKEIYDEERKGGVNGVQATAATRKKAVRLLNRLYEECVIPRESLGIGTGKDGIYRRRILGEVPLNAFVFNDFVARFVSVGKGSDTFDLTAHADLAMAWVVLGGALSVTSPSGIKLDMKEGDACLFPASASGGFQIDVQKEPTRYVAISAPVNAGLGPRIFSAYKYPTVSQ